MMSACEALCDMVACNYNSPAACEVTGTDFASAMIDGGNFGWDTIPVETDDGYQLNVINIYKPDFSDPTKGPLLLVHDTGSSAIEWLDSNDAGSDLLVN